MADIVSQEVNIEMRKKLPDGTYRVEYPKTRSDSGVTFDEHLADIVTQAEPNKIPKALGTGKLDLSWIPRFTPNIQVFEENGTFVVPDGVAEVFVEVVGGGGCGQGGKGKNSEIFSGGGGGGYAFKLIKNIIPNSEIAVTVGKGGVGSTEGFGTGGGTSSFGTYVSATGGTGLTGGNGVGGDVIFKGQDGVLGGIYDSTTYSNLWLSGAGGGSYFGSGAYPPPRVNHGSAGNAGIFPGAGGSGAHNQNYSDTNAGGNGADGIVIVRW